MRQGDRREVAGGKGGNDQEQGCSCRLCPLGEGFRENTLPAVNGFVQRLRANRPSIEVKHTNSGNFLTGIRIVSAESTADETDFFPPDPV